MYEYCFIFFFLGNKRIIYFIVGNIKFINWKKGEIIIFLYVILNVSGGYNVFNGIFIVLCSGVYVFMFILVILFRCEIRGNLVVNGLFKVGIYFK